MTYSERVEQLLMAGRRAWEDMPAVRRCDYGSCNLPSGHYPHTPHRCRCGVDGPANGCECPSSEDNDKD